MSVKRLLVTVVVDLPPMTLVSGTSTAPTPGQPPTWMWAGCDASAPAGLGCVMLMVTTKAAAPIGPYNQAIKANGFVFVAGEKGIDPRTGKIVDGGIAAETRQTLENIKNILDAAGSSFDRAVQSCVYMTDLSDFGAMNQV